MGIRSDYLDLAIGLAVVFFLTSLLVSGLNEGLQWAFRVRSKFLWAYLYDLVDPTRQKILPRRWGIFHLWRPRFDPRPTVQPGDVAGPPGTAATGGAATGADPHQLVCDLARALDPLDVPQLTRKGPGRHDPPTRATRTAIQHVPPGSLAQAFVEVFTELGKGRLAEALAELGTALSQGQPTGAAAERVAREVAPADDDAARAVAAAVDALLVGAETLDGDERAGAFTRALSAVPPGGRPPPSLATVAGQLLGLMRPAASGPPERLVPAAPAEDIVAKAREMAGPLARTFPDRFVRERIDIAVDRLGPSPLGPTARRLWEGAEGRLDDFRSSLEGYLDGELTRLGGYYRRSIRSVLIVLAVLVAVATNVDAVGLSRQLWRNPAGRAALVAQATAASQPPTTTPGAPGSSAESPPDAGLAELQRQCEAAGPGTDDTIDSPEDAARALSGIRHCIADAVGAQSGLDVIDGAAWISPSEWWHRWSPSSSRAWWLHLVGVALTAAALVLGAPFWFDIGKRLTGARRGLVGQA